MGNDKEKIEKSKILIVDDNIATVKLFADIIKDETIEIFTSYDGFKAIQIANEIQPDLVLLDITMPGINGFEVCRILKNNDLTKEISIIFITSNIATEDILTGFSLGAADYITKPFNSSELKARINTHLQIQNYKKQIILDNIQLERLNIEKNEFLGIAAHDLKNPLFSISLMAKVLRDENLEPNEIKEFSKDILSSTNRMLEIIRNLLDINAIEDSKVKFDKHDQPLLDLMNYVIKNNNENAKNKSIKLQFEVQENLISNIDTNAFIQTIDNLISNAIKFSPFEKKIFIRLYRNDSFARVEVQDEGPGLSKEDMGLLFGKFTKLSARPTGGENSTGLGLSIVKLYVENMGGKIWCESKLGEGAKFILELPLA